MNCPNQQTISAFVDGELEATQAAEVKRHVVACASCRQFFEEMQWLEARGRSALDAIHVGETPVPNVVQLRPASRKWARPMSLAAAAVALLAFSIWTWFASSHFSSNQSSPSPHLIANGSATATGRNLQSERAQEAAFEQWLAPYRELRIPLVPMEVAANYQPAPIFPIQFGNH
jgi:anti-sigma factor RsiW